MKNSKFIVIEGLEGAGKTSAIQTVVDTLKQQGITDLAFTREPGELRLQKNYGID